MRELPPLQRPPRRRTAWPSAKPATARLAVLAPSDSKITYDARPKSPGRRGSPAAGAAPSRFVFVDLGHRDLRRAVGRPVTAVLVASAVGVVALILVIDGCGLAGQPVDDVHCCLLSRRLQR